MAHKSDANRSQPTHRYLNVAELARLRNVEFRSRRWVEGQYSGRHTSPQRGQSVEFQDYRDYVPGDNVGDIDWQVYGRSDKLFIKLFEHQTEMSVHLVVDGSASMAYPEGGTRLGKPAVAHTKAVAHSKYDHACRMAAAIAFLVTRQQDRVSFTLAHGGLGQFVPPGRTFNHLNGVLDAMEAGPPSDTARLADALHMLAERTKGKGIIAIFSDLLEDREAILKALARFAHRGSDVIVFHVLHQDELELPRMSEAVFHDSETSQRVRLNVEDIRPAYEKKMRAFLDGWSQVLRGRGMDYNLVSTATPYHRSLERYLFSRAATAK